jgi:hypothetical protein
MKKQLVSFIALFVCAYAVAQTLLSGVTATGPGNWVAPTLSGPKQYQATARTPSGTGTAVITVECTMDGSTPNTLGTISFVSTPLTTTTVGDMFPSNDRCKFLRGNPTTLTGSATVNLYMGE